MAGVLRRGRDMGVLDTERRPCEEAEDHHLPTMERGRRRTKPSDPLTLDFQPLELWEHPFQPEPPSLWRFVMAALTNSCRCFVGQFLWRDKTEQHSGDPSSKSLVNGYCVLNKVLKILVVIGHDYLPDLQFRFIRQGHSFLPDWRASTVSFVILLFVCS